MVGNFPPSPTGPLSGPSALQAFLRAKSRRPGWEKFPLLLPSPESIPERGLSGNAISGLYLPGFFPLWGFFFSLSSLFSRQRRKNFPRKIYLERAQPLNLLSPSPKGPIFGKKKYKNTPPRDFSGPREECSSTSQEERFSLSGMFTPFSRDKSGPPKGGPGKLWLLPGKTSLPKAL